MPTIVPFEYLAHVLTVPVRVGDLETRFVVDTGIGMTLISEALAAQVGCAPSGSTFTGRRMSGNAVTVPLGTPVSLALGTHQLGDVPIGILDMHAMAGLEGVEGFLSLSFFRTAPVTIDYSSRRLILEDEASLARRAAAGTCVNVDVEYDECSTDLSLGLDLPSGRSIKVEVDTGSDVLILNEALAGDARVDLQARDVQKVEGDDETGHKFVRYFTTLAGHVSVSGAPHLRMSDPPVMFQKIIYDGLIGDKFLRNFTTTYDIPNGRMIFATPVSD